MSVKSIKTPSLPSAPAAASLVLAVLLVAALSDAVLAQGPFGAGPSASAPPEAIGGIIGWVMRQQAIYYREFTGMIRAAKQSGSVAYGLLGLSFTYGVFHAAGPGHGKAVISSYLFANGESWRRGVTLSFASALLQSLVAVAIVAVAAVLLGGTARMMGAAVRNIEIASYLLVIAVGLRLAWVKGGGFLAEWRTFRRPILAPMPVLALAAGEGAILGHFPLHEHSHDHEPSTHGHGTHGHGTHARGAVGRVAAQAHAHDHGHHHHDHASHVHDHHDHDHDTHGSHDQDGACLTCGHAHGPQPQDLAGPGGWRRGLSAIMAAGLRPCSGAIIVLVFSLTQGLFWTGVASTFAMGLGTAITVAALATLAVGARSLAARLAGGRHGFGLLALRGVEVCAALAVILVGVLLLTGYMASERMFLV
jgi:nickel/cobalt exporter